MADVFDPSKRSDVMSRIRSSGTKIEKRLFAIVRELIGPQRRMVRNAKSLPGRPDVYVPALSLAIFADGCFFHGCPRHGHIPKSNSGYWGPKLNANVKRDGRNRRELRSKYGMAVWRVWEHDLEGSALERTTELLARRIAVRQSKLLTAAKAQSLGQPYARAGTPLIAAERRSPYSVKSH